MRASRRRRCRQKGGEEHGWQPGGTGARCWRWSVTGPMAVAALSARRQALGRGPTRPLRPPPLGQGERGPARPWGRGGAQRVALRAWVGARVRGVLGVLGDVVMGAGTWACGGELRG